MLDDASDFFLHFVFRTQIVDWLPRSYAFMEAWCLALFLWAMACKENPEPVSLVSVFLKNPSSFAVFLISKLINVISQLLVSLVTGIVFDIIHMWLSFGSSYKTLVGMYLSYFR